MVGTGDGSGERASEIIDFLTASSNRVTIVRTLAEHGRMDRYELEEFVDATRRTVLRTVKALEEEGYVEESRGRIGLTALGEHVWRCYQAFADAVALDADVEQFLAAIPADGIGVDVDRLRDGEVTLATEGSPYAPLDRTLDLRADASEIRELAPSVEQRSVEQLAERLEGGEQPDVEIILTEASLAAAEEEVQYAESHGIVLAADSVDIAVYPEPFEMTLGLLDETVVLFAAGGGQPLGVLETEDPVVREWAEDVLDRHRAAASIVETPDDVSSQ